MAWVLIVLSFTGGTSSSWGMGGFSAEFNTKDACEAAKTRVVERMRDRGQAAFCTPKGEAVPSSKGQD